MSSTLVQSAMNFSAILHDNDNSTKASSDEASRASESNDQQLTIKNVQDLPRHELEEFLKVKIDRLRDVVLSILPLYV